MTKKQWFIVTAPLFLVWISDFYTKQWATHLANTIKLGPIDLTLYHNHGVMLGLFLELPAVLRIVSLSTGGAFLLSAYALIQYLLPIKSLTLRAGLSFLMGGIIGNVTDRIIWGYVVDFIIIRTPFFMSPVFNLADLLQWVGYGLILYAIIKEGHLLWPDVEMRKRFWIHKGFQLKYCLILMSVGLALALISLVFSYTYMRVTIGELIGNNNFLMNKFLIPFIWTYGVISVVFSMILFTLGKIMSHRIAGPIYAFERFLTDLMDGKDSQLKLRSGDDLKHLEEIAANIKKKLSKIQEPEKLKIAD